MNNRVIMAIDYDRQRKIQAAIYTAAIAGALLLIVWFVKFHQPVVPPPPVEEYVEINLPEPPPEPLAEDVNLGNNDVGSGKVQPIVTGTPTSAPVTHNDASEKSNSSEQATKDFDEDNDRDAPPITKPTVTNTNKEITNNPSNQSTVTKPDPRPRAVMTSTRGSGNGGNTDVPGMNRPSNGQGPGDGPGDKGTYNGNPKATNFGVKMYPIGNQSFEDDFNQNAKVAMLVEVDANGKVTSASHTSKGSTGTATKNMISIAQRRAFQVKFPATGSPQKGTLIFDFSVR